MKDETVLYYIQVQFELQGSPDEKKLYTLIIGNMVTEPSREPSCTTAPHHTRALWPSSRRMTPMITLTYDRVRTKATQAKTCVA